MKRILFFIVAIMISTSASAQHVTNYNTKVASIYHGKPYILTEIQDANVCITVFDKEGRIISEKRNNYRYEIRYTWTPTEIIMSLYNENDILTSQSTLKYISEPDRLMVGKGHDYIDFYFNKNGTIDIIKSSEGERMGEMKQFYDSKDLLSWNKTQVFINNKLCGEINIKTSDFDEKGNWTRITQTINNKEVIGYRKITYYE